MDRRTSSLSCRCGRVQAQVDLGQAASRCRCYCKYCQAYALLLGGDHKIMNAEGGTEIIATPPYSIQFERGLGELGCMSLTAKGPLRWYSNCCRTPIGNTSRNPKLAYVGLIRCCLNAPDASLDRALGPLRVALNTESAQGQVKATPAATFVALLKIGQMLLSARLHGRHRINPFFDTQSLAPIQTPQRVRAG